MDREECGLSFHKECPRRPDDEFRLGRQTDTGEDYYCVLAHTEHGVIPGKIKAGVEECWYPYGGEEHTCPEFEWLSSNGQSVKLVENKEEEEPPSQALLIGSQEDGSYYVAVAHTEEDGDIPGKAKDGNCWYPLAGEERTTNHFSYVTLRKKVLRDGMRIHLESKHGGNVRVTQDNEVDGTGGNGHWATFTVIMNDTDGTVKLQNEKRPERYLAIRKCGLTTGSGGRYCVFKPRVHKNGDVTFQSANFPGRHIGINEDQSPRNPKETHTGVNARFTIVEKEEE